MISKYALPNYLRHWKKHFFGREPYEIGYKDFRMFVRPRTYDFFTIGETMVNEDYRPTVFPEPPRFKTIVDLGANIGDFTVWAALKYSPKKLVAVEMEEDNYEILLKNIRVNNLTKIVTPIKAAIYSTSSKVGVKRQLIKGSMDMLDERDGSKREVKAITLRELMDSSEIRIIDFLKIDVEGSEKFILTKDNNEVFRKCVRYAFVETHTFLGADPEQPLKYFSELRFKIKVHQTFRPHHPYLIEAVNDRLGS